MAEQAASGKPLFEGVRYTIIPGPGISDEQEEKLRDLLGHGGAEYIPLSTCGRVDEVVEHTHILSETVDFPDYYSALDANVQVVRPSWVTTSCEKRRQSQTRQHSPDPAMFFSQVILSCAELPQGDKDAIIAGVLAMGGLYSNPLTKLVTHLVTLDPNVDKCKMAMHNLPHCKIVLPHWFDDCFRLGKLINEAPYSFPDPEVLQPGLKSPIRARRTSDLEGATSAIGGKPPTYQPPHSPSPSRKQLAVFEGKKILFSKDLNINEHLAKTLQSLVTQAGGQMTASVEECDVYIGHYRDGLDYVAASRAGKEVANLAWFYNVINRNKWTNPLSKLLHYPVPRDGLPGFRDMRISLSNYSGEARIYLENLIKTTGAEFTKTMKQDNTHLITAHKQSEKCEAAEEWNINIINHLWLEESYAKCAPQSLTHSRYTHFPPRTNLGEIVGKTPINLDLVRKHFFPDTEAGPEVEKGAAAALPGAHPYRGAVKAAPPTRSPKKTAPASSAAPTTAATSDADAAMAEPMETVEEVLEELPAPQTAKKPRARKLSDVGTPAHGLMEARDKETPPTSGRASKARAMNLLHKQSDDIALYQREMKRKGGVVHGGRRTSTPEIVTKTTTKGKKRSSGGGDVDTDGDAEMADGTDDEAAKLTAPQTKKAKTTAKRSAKAIQLPPVQFRMLVTGDERWANQPKKEDEEKRKLRNLGIELVIEPSECTVLCAPRILRTRKFVSALAMNPIVVSVEYLNELLRTNKFIHPLRKTLSDQDGESKYSMDLRGSLERARENKNQLLHGWTVFVTEKVPGGFDTWKDIIGVNGGTVQLYRGRTGLQFPKARIPPSQDPAMRWSTAGWNLGKDAHTEVDRIYLVSGTHDDEVKLWKTFRTQAEKQGLRPRIAITEWVLNMAMNQQIEWDDKWELKEESVPGWKEKYGR